MEEGVVIFNHSTTADSIYYVFNDNDNILYNPIETGIEEIKSGKDAPVNSVNVEINTTVSSTVQYGAFIDNYETADISGSVTTINYGFPSGIWLEENEVNLNYEPTEGTASVSAGILTQEQMINWCNEYGDEGGYNVPIYNISTITIPLGDTLKTSSFFNYFTTLDEGFGVFHV